MPNKHFLVGLMYTFNTNSINKLVIIPYKPARYNTTHKINILFSFVNLNHFSFNLKQFYKDCISQFLYS